MSYVCVCIFKNLSNPDPDPVFIESRLAFSVAGFRPNNVSESVEQREISPGAELTYYN